MLQPPFKMTSAALQTTPLVLHSAVAFPVAFSNCSTVKVTLHPSLLSSNMCFWWSLSFCCPTVATMTFATKQKHSLGKWHLPFKLGVTILCINLFMNELQLVSSFMRITPSLGGWYSDLLHFKDWLNYWFLADLAVWILLWCMNCSSSISMLMNTTGKREGRGQQFCFQQNLMFRRELCD